MAVVKVHDMSDAYDEEGAPLRSLQGRIDSLIKRLREAERRGDALAALLTERDIEIPRRWREGR